LSSLTIQKLVSIVKMKDSNKITSVDLAERLGVTVRNANRILGNLEKGGVAEVVYTESVATKGRPVKVYELKF
ncbi:MAG: winged helix-turn-helix transcriptional regulator, partial [Peptacetobacter hiranonis]|nr:winged helix-turn-helix transcriptional regulator [Peptacetobacter hiranonis]